MKKEDLTFKIESCRFKEPNFNELAFFSLIIMYKLTIFTQYGELL